MDNSIKKKLSSREFIVLIVVIAAASGALGLKLCNFPEWTIFVLAVLSMFFQARTTEKALNGQKPVP